MFRCAGTPPAPPNPPPNPPSPPLPGEGAVAAGAESKTTVESFSRSWFLVAPDAGRVRRSPRSASRRSSSASDAAAFGLRGSFVQASLCCAPPRPPALLLSLRLRRLAAQLRAGNPPAAEVTLALPAPMLDAEHLHREIGRALRNDGIPRDLAVLLPAENDVPSHQVDRL